MTDSHFDQLLKVAASQPEPQQLLFVFTSAELPADATEAQRERFLRWRRKFGQLAKVGSTSMKDGRYDWEAEAVHG